MARAARRRWAAGESQNSIAKCMGVCQGTIHNVVYRKSWKDV